MGCARSTIVRRRRGSRGEIIETARPREVVDESRNARLAGTEAFLSLAVLRLSTSDGGIGARIPLNSIHREEYMQPIFGANYLTGLAVQDGATVRWTLEFLSAGAAQFASVFFRAVRAARSAAPRTPRRSRPPPAWRARPRPRRASGPRPCPSDGAPSADLPTATACDLKSPARVRRQHRRGISEGGARATTLLRARSSRGRPCLPLSCPRPSPPSRRRPRRPRRP